MESEMRRVERERGGERSRISSSNRFVEYLTIPDFFMY